MLARTSFSAEPGCIVGRETDLAELTRRFATARLLTLVGAGGVGKSRLALSLADSMRDAFPDGTRLADLAELTGERHVERAIAEVLSIRPATRQPWRQALRTELRSRQLLLILDNCERLVAPIANIALNLLRTCPQLRVLVTSREPLEVEGEVVWRVPPLSVPTIGTDDVSQVASSAAVRLFVDRADAYLPGFVVTEDNAGAVAEICRRVGGVPLALELAAEHAATIGIGHCVFDAGFALWMSSTRARPSRQHTLRANLDWSYALLRGPERALLRRLAVFVGGWTLDAAETVCADTQLPVDTVVDALDRLVNLSFVHADHLAQPIRYRFTDLSHHYALELLHGARELATMQRRHALNVLSLVDEVAEAPLDAHPVTYLEHEQDNLRAALYWSLQHNETRLALRLAIAAYPFWYQQGQYSEGFAWLTHCLATPADKRWLSERATAACLAGHLCFLAGDPETAQTLFDQALDARRSLRDCRGIAFVRHLHSRLALWRGDLSRAYTLNDACLSAPRGLDNGVEPSRFVRSAPIAVSARLALEFDHERRACELATEAEDLARVYDDRAWLAYALSVQALVTSRAGQHARAIQMADQSVSLLRTAGGREWLVEALCTRGHLELDRGAVHQGYCAFIEALDIADQNREWLGVINAIEGLARVLRTERPAAAATLAAATENLRDQLGCSAWPSQRERNAAWLTLAQAKLGPDAYASARCAAQGMSATEVVHLARFFDRQLRDEQVACARATVLTQREHEVARLVAQGLSNKRIASDLCLSVGTIRSHVDHILTKLGLHSRAQVAVWAAQAER